MAASAIVLSYVLLEVDTRLSAEAVRDLGWLYSFGPEGARAVLSAIASSMITVAGLTFSITMLTLQLASSQFGPRLLRNFMRDRGNQLVLGTFIATFVYCLLVLRTVRGTEVSSFVPHLSVAVGVLLAIASLAVLIYFIHHVATSIRIESVLAELAAETRSTIDRLYPARLGRSPAPAQIDSFQGCASPQMEFPTRAICARRSGYVQRIDEAALMRIATRSDLVVRVEARPGRFVPEGAPLLSIWPRQCISDEVAAQLQDLLIIGADRTPYQDLAFSIRRIVEIAQRALSPGINDPTTALYCIDRLSEALNHLADRDMPSPMRFDDRGNLRVLSDVNTLEEMARPALTAIARYGIGDADVVQHLLEVIDDLSRKAEPGPRETISALGQAIRRESEDQLRLALERRPMRAPPIASGDQRPNLDD